MTGNSAPSETVEFRAGDESVEVKYTFKVNGETYSSSKYKCEDGACQFVPDFVITSAAIADASRAGNRFTVLYLPHNPSINGPLAIGASPALLFALLVGACGMGGYGMTWVFNRG